MIWQPLKLWICTNHLLIDLPIWCRKEIIQRVSLMKQIVAIIYVCVCVCVWNIHIICIYRIRQFLFKLKSSLDPWTSSTQKQSCCGGGGGVGSRCTSGVATCPSGGGSRSVFKETWRFCGTRCETPGSGPPSQLCPVESDPQGVKWLPDYSSHESGSVLPFSPHVPPTSGRRAAALRNSRENSDMSFLPSRPNPHRAHKTRDSQPEQGQQGPVSWPLRLRPISTESGRAMPCLWCSD